MKKALCLTLCLIFTLVLLLTALPAMAQGDKLVLLDEGGVYLEVTSVEMKDDMLRYNVIVENDTGCEINIRFTRSEERRVGKECRL